MIDNTDKKLISILREDGRTSLSEIGKALGMSHVAVSKRLDKLIKTDMLKISAGINSEAMDTKVLFLGLETESMEIAENIKKKYMNCPRVLMFAPVTGSYNLFAMMIAEDTWSLESILGTCSMRTEPGIRKSETWFGNAPIIPKFLPLNLAPEQTSSSKAPCKMDCEACKRYAIDKCVGCPNTSSYKGTLWATPSPPKKKRAKSKS
ncbi:MAG: Lrp/AsnC family transcriptional regulator [Candidatus Thorarchaeota archaeon]|nr:MAG: Lrp/AsnC family transcriptional regulator [Candidatus Thorarchaeota archaeon]